MNVCDRSWLVRIKPRCPVVHETSTQRRGRSIRGNGDQRAAYNRIVATAGRILALDLGKKRIGLALSDELGVTAQGLETLEREGRRTDIEALRRLAIDKRVTLILMGDPL